MICTTLPALSVRSYGPAHGSHSHDHFQILWSLDGSLELEIEGVSMKLNAGDGVVISPSERHDFESRAGNRCLVLDTFDPDWAARQRTPQFAHATGHLARFLSEAIKDHIPISQEYSAFLMAQSWGNAPAPQRARREIDWLQLTRWVKAHLAHPLTAAQLAGEVHLSESQFRARCIAATGSSPLQWVRRLRLEQARILRARGMSVAEAARRVGYHSPAAMTAAMQRDVRKRDR